MSNLGKSLRVGEFNTRQSVYKKQVIGGWLFFANF